MSEAAIFLRHGESTYNVRGLCNDDPAIAVPLTERGRRQIEAVADRLVDRRIDLVIVSQLPRARESATIVNRRHGAPVRIDHRLDDRRSGFEGRTVAEYLAAREDDPARFAAHGGESYAGLKARVVAALSDIASLPERLVLVVSHHEVLQVVHGHLTGLPDEASRNFAIANGEFFEHGLRR